MSAPEPKAPASDLDAAVGRESAAWFADRAGKLGCDNWRGPETVLRAARRIAELEAALSSQSQAAEGMAKALEFYADRQRYDGPNQRMSGREPDHWTSDQESYLRDVTRDGGDIARTALSHYRTLGGE